jgi:hypothetical protein
MRKYKKETASNFFEKPYIYRRPGTRNPNSYDMFSAGLDWQVDTSDDNWNRLLTKQR